MIIYFERLEDGTIGTSTTNLEYAKEQDFKFQTEEQILTISDGVRGDKKYLQSEFDALQQTQEYQDWVAGKEEEQRQLEIEQELLALDMKSIRSIRAILANDSNPALVAEDISFLEEINSQALNLRAERNEIDLQAQQREERQLETDLKQKPVITEPELPERPDRS